MLIFIFIMLCNVTGINIMMQYHVFQMIVFAESTYNHHIVSMSVCVCITGGHRK